MSYKQIQEFKPANMGNRAGWCLQNCREGFGIPNGHYPSAKADMEAQRLAGTLHPIETLPKDVSVPVYLDTPSEFEHVVVSHRGLIYEDGRQSSISGRTAFGWGECIDGVRVVEWENDPTPESSTEGFNVGDVVVPTELVDYDGTPLVQYDETYTVIEVIGDRAVLSARGAVWAAMNTANIRKA